MSDGLARFAAGEVDTIVIAGMGGELMARILGDCDWIQNPEITLILQPMTAVRAFAAVFVGAGLFFGKGSLLPGRENTSIR